LSALSACAGLSAGLRRSLPACTGVAVSREGEEIFLGGILLC
jgi:hypothetical protein